MKRLASDIQFFPPNSSKIIFYGGNYEKYSPLNSSTLTNNNPLNIIRRGINPPHRIKSISMSTFTPEEVELMRTRGNLWCSRVWLGNYEASTNPVDYKDDEKIKEFMITKVSFLSYSTHNF